MHRTFLLLGVAGAVAAFSETQQPIHYTLSFPQLEHRWMQVEATFTNLDQKPLELRMSRSSPGRYSLHDFAKNVYDVHAFSRDGRELPTSMPDPYGWDVGGGNASVTVRYKVYGDTVDGTYLAVDTTHAHVNMPAAIMWARGLDDRSVTLDFVPPGEAHWQVATQLHPGSTPFEFTAPNLQYLMDSPVEFGPIVLRQFTVGSRVFRVSLHHTGDDADVDGFVKDVEKIVREEGAIYGEFPSYEPGHYTFIADYLPHASGDGMEHRNSTVMTSARSIRKAQTLLLGTVAHEFFHSWNVERIRPQGLEPFDFDRANLTDSLWLAEGFTQYYGSLVLKRAGLVELSSTDQTLAQLVDTVTLEPGRLVRSAVEMSRMASFIDGARPVDRTDWPNTVISYYPFGGAIALALDLSLRSRSDCRIGLDDFMRAMWRKYGKPGGAREGYVDRPYTVDDAEATLAEVSGDRSFANDFFARYIEGHEAADYAPLLAQAGLVLRKLNAGRAWWGDLRLEPRDGVLWIEAPVLSNSPAYAAGFEQDDEIRQIESQRMASPEAVVSILGRHRPGDAIQVVMADRGGTARDVVVTLAEDPHHEIVPVESTGVTLTEAQKTFRDRWLGPKR